MIQKPLTVDQFDEDAQDILRVLHPRIMENIALKAREKSEPEERASKHHIAEVLNESATSVRDLLQMVKPGVRWSVSSFASSNSKHRDRKNRNKKDVMEAIRHAAFCARLGAEL